MALHKDLEEVLQPDCFSRGPLNLRWDTDFYDRGAKTFAADWTSAQSTLSLFPEEHSFGHFPGLKGRKGLWSRKKENSCG